MRHLLRIPIINLPLVKVFIVTLLCTTIFNTPIFSQVKPKEGSKLNYRLIGFSFGAKPTGKKQIIEIAAGWYNSSDSFKRNIIEKLYPENGRVIGIVPSFGAKYTWRVIDSTLTTTSGTQTAKMYHFSTGTSKNIDSELVRINVMQNNQSYQDAYFLSDENKVMYDMNGKPVWFLPNIEGLVNEYSVIRDLKMSPQGTITVLTKSKPIEIDYDGKVLWAGPNNNITTKDTTEFYHHEFSKLKSGNYMVMGNEKILWEWRNNGNNDSALYRVDKEKITNKSRIFRNTHLGTILEFNKEGKLIWSWKASDHVKETSPLYGAELKNVINNHENSFYFDEKEQVIYISYKSKNNVVKIKYPTGNVLAIYGEQYNSSLLFSNQHSCSKTSDGLISLYSNNLNTYGDLPAVVLLKEPSTPNEKLEKIWEYVYPSPFSDYLAKLTSGGNVIELPDHSFFVSSCTPFSTMYIVNRNKQLLWNATLEKYNVAEQKWALTSQYRANIITDKKILSKLIFGK